MEQSNIRPLFKSHGYQTTKKAIGIRQSLRAAKDHLARQSFRIAVASVFYYDRAGR